MEELVEAQKKRTLYWGTYLRHRSPDSEIRCFPDGGFLYPGFLEQISGGKDLFLIPSSIHEWLYLEDKGELTAEELTELLRAVNREVVEEEEVLSDQLYYYDGKKGEMRRA